MVGGLHQQGGRLQVTVGPFPVLALPGSRGRLWPVSIGFTRLPNPAHLQQHLLWRLSKPDGRTVSACLRQVPHGTELVIFFKGDLLWSEVFTDSREAGHWQTRRGKRGRRRAGVSRCDPSVTPERHGPRRYFTAPVSA